MLSINPGPLPRAALLRSYQKSDHYTDCYVTHLAGTVTLAQFVQAFYTTPVFKLERVILRFAVSRPSSNEQATQLAHGSRDTFAAWKVEQRRDNQLLMCDYRGRTRSWFMTEPVKHHTAVETQLYFGSAVVAASSADTGTDKNAPGFRLLLAFHRLYSKVLLSAARSRLMATGY